MGIIRSILLAASEKRWLREQVTRLWFVRRTVSRFMPGETLDDALAAACVLRENGLGTVFTYLGENVADSAERRELQNIT